MIEYKGVDKEEPVALNLAPQIPKYAKFSTKLRPILNLVAHKHSEMMHWGSAYNKIAVRCY